MPLIAATAVIAEDHAVRLPLPSRWGVGRLPFGAAAFEASGRAARTWAVGDDLDATRERLQAPGELLDRERAGTGDVTGGELGRRGRMSNSITSPATIRQAAADAGA